MPQNQVTAQRAEIKRLQFTVSKLTGQTETMSLKIEQLEDALAKRRSEVATLHQACAKNKRARIVCAQRLRHLTIRTAPTSQPNAAAAPPIIETPTIAAQETTTKKQRTLAVDSPANENTPKATPAGDDNAERPAPPPPQENQTVCVRCQKMQVGLRELAAGHDRFSQLITDAKEDSRQSYAQLMRETDESFERARREMAASARRNMFMTDQQYIVFRRRRNGCADAG